MRLKILFAGFTCSLIFCCTEVHERSFAPIISMDTGTTMNRTVRDTLQSHQRKLAYTVEQLDNTVGLSNSSVNTIFQDSDNLLWIGTWDGLNRYDGSNFEIFRPELDNSSGLSNQVILKIDEDRSGNIWVLTMDGINKYDKNKNTFITHYFSRKGRPPLTESEFNMALDHDKTVFCAVKDWGFGYYDGEKFVRLNATGLPKATVKMMAFSSNRDLLVLYGTGEHYLLRINDVEGDTKQITKVQLLDRDIREFVIVPEGRICSVSQSGMLQLYPLQSHKNRAVLFKDIHKIIGIVPEGIVLSNKSGYFMMDLSGKMAENTWLGGLQKNKLTTLIKGSENIYWTGTDGDGIFKAFPINKSFNVVSKKQVPELDGSIVRAFLETDDHSFWVGTKGKGLFRFSKKMHSDSIRFVPYLNYNGENSVLDNSVYSLYQGRDKLVFIGTDGHGMHIYDLEHSKLIAWKDIEGTGNISRFSAVYTIYQDKEGTVWLGTNGYGMLKFKLYRTANGLKVTDFKAYTANNGGGGSLSSNIVFSIIPYNNDKLWIGTRLGGLNFFDKKSETFRIFKNERGNDKSLSNNDILCLYTDSQKRLWVGTSFGLNLLERFGPKGKAVFKSFTVKDGLPNNTIHGIVSDVGSNLWISTNFGLSNFVPSRNKFTNYTKNEGLQNNEFADGAFYTDTVSNLIFMGGIKGYNYFLPSEIGESHSIPNILIKKISGQNQQNPYFHSLVVSNHSRTAPSLVLGHDQNFFDIELAALTYINAEKCQYAYQLGNFDKNWNHIGTRSNFSFTNVPAGNYTLWLKWSNSDGIWSEPVKALDIEIKPIFWRSTAAMVLYLLIFCLFLLAIFGYYKKRESLRESIIFQKREEEIHQNRLTFFTNIAHELQTPLTLIVGPVQKLSESIGISGKNQRFIKMIQQNSSRLLFLTQQLLEFRKAEYDHLEVMVKQFDLVNLVEQIAELFDEWAIQKNIDYKVDIPSEMIGWFDKDKIEKILFNLLSNAFKYTPQNGKIKVAFSIDGEGTKFLNIKTVNTGKGIQKDKLDSLFHRFTSADIVKSSEKELFRTGIGLAYIQRLATVMGGKISVRSKENKHTTFAVALPCSKDAFEERELDTENEQVFISHHLKNILDDNGEETFEANKISSLEAVLNDRKTVLVVEDKRQIHLWLNELLREKYKILTAYNGVEALEILKDHIPDIIISDVMMPKMDGITLCAQVKSNLNTCHIPFVMLTAKSSVQHQIEGLESGANAYIPKPFHPEHLMIRIQKLLEEKEMIQHHFAKNSVMEDLPELPVAETERDFVKKVVKLIQNNIEEEYLQSLYLEKELGMSSSQLYRKTKELFGFSPGDLIRTMRLRHAAQLLQTSSLTVSQVCYRSGFNNRSHFYREFKKMFSITPKNYQLKHKSSQISL